MSEFIHNKTSGNLVTVLIGLIILSFMFTGYQAFENGGSSNTIAKVGSYSVSPQEYEQEYRRQIEFFKQMFGGELSAKQIEAMKIKESTLRNLIQKKLMLKLSNEVGLYPSESDIKREIKALPYFQTNNQFDIERYKGLLAANKLTPQEFEEDVKNQMKLKALTELNPTYPVSEGYFSDLQKFRADKLDVDVITFSRDSIRKHINVTNEEVTKFLADSTNKNRVVSMYNERKASIEKPEEITARHILVTTNDKAEEAAKTQIEKIAKEVNASNFAKMADKYTEDPSGKGKGGALGSFPKGAMVPEFEKVAFSQKIGTVSAPVKTQFGYHIILVEKKTPAVVSKIEDYQDKFARELIQKSKTEEIKNTTVQLSNDLRKALDANNDKEVKALLAKYEITMKKADVNRVDGISNGANLSTENMKEIFSGDLSKSKVVLVDDGSTINILKTYPQVKAAVTADTAKLASDTASLKNVLGKKMMEGIIKKLEKDTSVKIFNNMIAE